MLQVTATCCDVNMTIISAAFSSLSWQHNDIMLWIWCGESEPKMQTTKSRAPKNKDLILRGKLRILHTCREKTKLKKCKTKSNKKSKQKYKTKTESRWSARGNQGNKWATQRTRRRKGQIHKEKISRDLNRGPDRDRGKTHSLNIPGRWDTGETNQGEANN